MGLPDGRVDGLKDRDGEGRSLASSGLGLGDDVTTLQHLKSRNVTFVLGSKTIQ